MTTKAQLLSMMKAEDSSVIPQFKTLFHLIESSKFSTLEIEAIAGHVEVQKAAMIAKEARSGKK